MTEYHQAWLAMHHQRDLLYLVVFAAVAVAFYWYKFGLRRYYRLALAGAALPVIAGLGWGLNHLGG